MSVTTPDPSLWLLIPAKAAWLAKRRLAPLLSPGQRADLCHWFLENTLAQVAASGLDAAALVLTTDPEMEAMAARYGVATLPDPPGSDLNATLENGRAHALARGARAILVLPTDLPYLTGDALRALVARTGGVETSVVIAPDVEGVGTNALLLVPADAVPFRFGPGSASLHRAEARERAIPLVELRDPAFALDIDLPDHYAEFARRLVPFTEPG